MRKGADLLAENINSILAVDFGNVHTRALLIDLVEGAYRVVARAQTRTTAGFPDDSVVIGLRRAAEMISELTGRSLLTREGRIITPENENRVGVDAFISTASIGRPLRTVLIGLYPEMSLASLTRAAAGTYISVVETITIADGRTAQQRLNAIALANPDLIVLAGGTEDGAEQPVLDLARLARLALRLMKRTLPPTVLYAGNSALREQVAAIFQGSAAMLYADNVRPSALREALGDARDQLARAFDTFTEQRGAGFDQVSYQTRMGVLPTAQSYEGIIRYLGATAGRREVGALAVDLGSAVTTISAAVRGTVASSIRTDIGVGHSAASALEAMGTGAVRTWLPFNAADDEIIAYALNKTTRPASIPMSQRALFLEHALVRAALRHALNGARPLWTPDEALDDLNTPLPAFERVIGAGAAITDTGRPGMSALLLLDALQPVGVVRLQTDSSALIPALGALAKLNPSAVVQVLDESGLEELGTAICLSGTPRRGASAVTVSIVREDGEQSRHTIEGGMLALLNLPIGMQARVRVRVRGGHINGRRALRLTVTGGTAGLIIDARGRPLPLERTLKARAAQITTWYAQATGDAPIAIPDSWLAADGTPDAPPVETREPAAPLSAGDDADLDALFGAEAAQPKASPRRGRADKPEKAEKSPRGRGRRGKEPEAAPAAQPAPADDLDDLRSLF
jgi:hypothetical protein